MLQKAANTFDRIAEFVLAADTEVPESVLKHAAILLVDTIGVAGGAARLEAGRLARDFAVYMMAAGGAEHAAPILFDGRQASLAGAAFAAATQIDNLDAHDGYNPTKGHIGCAVVPSLFAVAHQRPDLSGREALKALVIAYEVAARAGLSLHASVSDYHTSGAWNALGVAALGCRLMGATPEQLRHAFGIAEYHGPRSQMMREIANPTMLHDGSGMGAFTGIKAAVLAMRGFTGAPAITIEASEAAAHWADLGGTWTTERNYIKPYPICRWAHAAIDAVRALMLQHGFAAEDVSSVTVRTFAQAACLFGGMPTTTSQAQYSLGFAVASMLRHGRIGVEHVAGEALNDPDTAAVLRRIEVIEVKRHSDRFPAGRWSDVDITLKDGRTLASGDVHARGGVEAPMSEAEIRDKFAGLTAVSLKASRSEAIWTRGCNLTALDTRFADLTKLVSTPVDHHA